MDIITATAFIIALGYNIYLANKISRTRKFTVEFKGSSNDITPLLNSRLQDFADINHDELERRTKNSMIDSLAYGYDVLEGHEDKTESKIVIFERYVIGKPITTIKDLEDFSNKFQILMQFTEELPGCFSLIIFKKDEQFVKTMINSNIGSGILVNYKVVPNNYGEDKMKLIKRMRG